MPLSELILPEFDHEMGNTRKALERVPDDRFAFKPHEKSMSLEQLVGHLSYLPNWGVETFRTDAFDLAAPVQRRPVKTRQDALEVFDGYVAAARAAIAAAGDDVMMQPWSLRNGENTIFTMPRYSVLRNFVMNHIIHHRAQLGMYFRLTGVPVPGFYGPSGDEQ